MPETTQTTLNVNLKGFFRTNNTNMNFISILKNSGISIWRNLIQENSFLSLPANNEYDFLLPDNSPSPKVFVKKDFNLSDEATLSVDYSDFLASDTFEATSSVYTNFNISLVLNGKCSLGIQTGTNTAVKLPGAFSSDEDFYNIRASKYLGDGKEIYFIKNVSANNFTANMDKIPSEIRETPVATDNKIIRTPYDSKIDNYKTKLYTFNVSYGSNSYVLINSDNRTKANGKYEFIIPSVSRSDDSIPMLLSSSAVSGSSDNLYDYFIIIMLVFVILTIILNILLFSFRKDIKK